MSGWRQSWEWWPGAWRASNITGTFQILYVPENTYSPLQMFDRSLTGFWTESCSLSRSATGGRSRGRHCWPGMCLNHLQQWVPEQNPLHVPPGSRFSLPKERLVFLYEAARGCKASFLWSADVHLELLQFIKSKASCTNRSSGYYKTSSIFTESA